MKFMKKSVSLLVALAFLTSFIFPVHASAQTCGDVYNGRLTFCSQFQFLSNGIAPYPGCRFTEQCYIGNSVGNNQCNWVIDNQGLKFCFGGFATDEELRNTTVQFRCVSNCGGANIINPLPNTPPFVAGDIIQTFSNANAPTADDGNGGRFSCVLVGGFDQSVINAINWVLDTTSLACGVAGVGAFLAPIAAGGVVGAVILPVRVTAGAAIDSAIVQECLNIVNRYTPAIETRVVKSNGDLACLKELTISLNDEDQVVDPTTGNILDPRGGVLAECGDQGKGIRSAIGCIPITDINKTTAFFLRWALGVGGGIALFLISISAIKIMTVRGDPKRVQDARDTLTAAIAGIVLIALSVFLVRFLTETLLQLF